MLHSVVKLRLDSYIHVDEHRINSRQTIPYCIRFELDRDCLSQIDLVSRNRQSIKLESERLTNIRYYALLVFSGRDNSELVFISYYRQNSESTPVVKSAIAASGKISQQILADWYDSKILDSIIKAHHWLISQIITQLPLKPYVFARWLWEIIALLITIIILAFVFSLISISYGLKILIFLGFFGILYLLLKRIVASLIKRIILNQLLFGWLGRSVRKRKIALEILNILKS